MKHLPTITLGFAILVIFAYFSFTTEVVIVYQAPQNYAKVIQTRHQEVETRQIEIPPELEIVAWCESKNKQFNDDGTVVKNYKTSDYGYFQINTYFWKDKADELGHDIFTYEGNVAMALYIYEHRGLEAWNSSKSCWGKMME